MGIIMIVVIGIVIGQFVLSPLRRRFIKPQFQGKLVWVTGASSGLGEAMCKRFAKLGATLILSARNVKEMERVKSECQNSDKHIILPMDFSKPEEVLKQTEEFITKLEKEGKKLDIVVENAGISQRSKFIDIDYENVEYINRLNYLGPVAHAKAYLGHMQKNKNGHIVIVSSTAGLIHPSFRCAYGASKSAISAFFTAVRSENVDFGVQVTNLYPGYVQTNVSKNALAGKAGQTLGKTDDNIKNGLTTDEFCNQAMQAIYSGEKEMIISDDMKQHLGPKIKYLFPNLAAKMLYKNLKQQEEAIKKAE